MRATTGRIGIIALLLCLCAARLSAGAEPVREFRGAWMATLYDARFSEDLSKKSVDEIRSCWRSMLDAAARVNVNAVFFQVRPCADAFCRLSPEPWSQHLRGEQGKAPEESFDPLAFMIEECHGRGMQLHAWLNPFRVTYSEGDEKKLAKGHNYFKHPDWFVKYGKSVYYDPGVPACRDWTVKVILDIASRYEIDGIHIDDYFYPYAIKDEKGRLVPFPDERSFATYGRGFTDVNAWRDDNSDLLVEEIARRLREMKPDVVFGVAPFNDESYCRQFLHCDSLKWACNGWVDYLIPQLYYGEDSRNQTFWWDAHAKGCPLFAGLRLMTLRQTVDCGPRKGLSELDNVLGMLAQTTNTSGVCWWPGNLMASSQADVVARLAPQYTRKTLVPLYRNRPRASPMSVTDVTAVSGDGHVTLSWRHPAPSAGRPPAVFTAVFRGDGKNPEVVTDKTSVTLDAGADDAFSLVALDRLQNAAVPTVVQAVSVDAPSRTYAWRGLMLDESRFFFGKEVVKETLDRMAACGLNVFHWHLTDDQGWRLEIRGCPELTRVGAFRRSSPKVHTEDVSDGKPYGPFFYTEEDVREIVDYAAARGIRVVPEIELPGHIGALLTAHPEFSCRRQVSPNQICCMNIYEDVLCVGNDAAIRYLEHVLDAVCRMFPDEVVHVGGDECPTVRWQVCPKCQARMRAEGIGKVRGLQVWVTQHFTRYLEKKGKRAMAWDEVIEGGNCPTNVIVQSWRSPDLYEDGATEPAAVRAARRGHEVVLSPIGQVYFSLPEGPDDPGEYRRPVDRYTSYVSRETVRQFRPDAGFPDVLKSRILGAECCCWSEGTRTGPVLHQKTWPRAAIFAKTLMP